MSELPFRAAPRARRVIDRRTALAALGTAAGLVALTACSTGSPAATPSVTASGQLDTVTAGKLTIATGQPAYSPWVIDNKPQSGKGFEAAVAYAVAEKLGFAKGDVIWTRTTFDSAIAPGPKDFDLNIQQFSITTQRKKAVDFSSPYYTTSQAIVTTTDSAAAKITTIAGLKGVQLGVATGTTSYTVTKDQVGVEPQIFNSNDDAVVALKSGQIDGLVTDLSTAFYLADAEVKHGTVLGQFSGSAGGDEFGIVLPKDSGLTTKVSAAVDAIRKSGQLAAITKKWLSTAVDVPVFS
jgi:polar amino acid transport system substrate-binding protein